MLSEAKDDLLVLVALANLSYKFKGVDNYIADWAWELSTEYAHRQGLEPNEAVKEVE
ncbi:hypothetical protein halTADL_1222 [Halohasta litchfieldiae]|uniref:Uncharacterized protein n=1 Tax=Halohasta litchfieldiae TaxID=1073996 RepID=A0A1H6WWS9_9EURY|nr:hypothetical protein [Halohasta litchfieldiae]ATW88009.1 hypothetical protein halTADL_1222 [Halohasta litchfieldiae]SEJ18727.1 hypothetical protein SAMN05444271_1293 [Halohasta litchfieldiae]